MFKGTAGRAVPQRAGSEETRRQILETALALFRERGFEETTIREIAAAGGLSLGAAYYYFKSKEAIVGAYYDYVHHEHQVRSREAFERGGDLRARLRAAMHTKIDIMQEDRRLLRALFRYGGDPDHALSWFGPATRPQRHGHSRLSTGAIAISCCASRSVSRAIESSRSTRCRKRSRTCSTNFLRPATDSR